MFETTTSGYTIPKTTMSETTMSEPTMSETTMSETTHIATSLVESDDPCADFHTARLQHPASLALTPRSAKRRNARVSATQYEHGETSHCQTKHGVRSHDTAVIVPLRDPSKVFDPTEMIIDAIARELTRRCGGNSVLNRIEAAAQFFRWLDEIHIARNTPRV